jgi:hypothetical protein
VVISRFLPPDRTPNGKVDSTRRDPNWKGRVFAKSRNYKSDAETGNPLRSRPSGVRVDWIQFCLKFASFRPFREHSLQDNARACPSKQNCRFSSSCLIIDIFKPLLSTSLICESCYDSVLFEKYRDEEMLENNCSLKEKQRTFLARHCARNSLPTLAFHLCQT